MARLTPDVWNRRHCAAAQFLAAEVDTWSVGEPTLAGRLYPRLRPDELLTADRNFYSFDAWASAVHTGAALLWRAPTQLRLPVVAVLADGTYTSVVVRAGIRGPRRERIIAAARAGAELDPDEAHLVRVIEYDVPDREGNGTGELTVLLTTIVDPGPRPGLMSWPPLTMTAVMSKRRSPGRSACGK